MSLAPASEHKRSWIEDLKEFSDTVEEDEFGILWAGPETAQHLMERAQTASRMRELYPAIEVAVPEERRADYLLYVAVIPEQDFFWPVPSDDKDTRKWVTWRNVVDGDQTLVPDPDDKYDTPRERFQQDIVAARGKLSKFQLPVITPRYSEEDVREHANDDLYALAPLMPGNAVKTDEINSIDRAFEEKVQIVQVLDMEGGHEPHKGMPKGVYHHMWASELIWVSSEMADLIASMAAGLPDDYEPRREDLGVIPDNALVMFAGDRRYNVYHANQKTGGRMGLLPMRAGYAHVASGWQETFTYGTKIGDTNNWHYRIFWAFVLLANEPIALRGRKRPERHALKRAMRRGLREPSDTVVMTLRRPRSEPTGEHRSVNWTHSWLVRSHWRNQWYPSEGRHKPRFIHPYVKGEGPLKVKAHAMRLIR